MSEPKLYVGVIAYMPWVDEHLLNLTNRSLERTVAAFGAAVHMYHASEAPRIQGLCRHLHRAWEGYGVPVHDYLNGSLLGNWHALLLDAFVGSGADWALFSSNDVLWGEPCRQVTRKLMEEGDPLTLYVANPMAAFLMSRELWERVRNPLDDIVNGYPPSGFEDGEVCMNVWAAGGDVVDGKWAGTYSHEAEASIRLLGPDYHAGQHPENFRANRETFVRRWGFTPEKHWPPTPEDVAEMRRRGGPIQ